MSQSPAQYCQKAIPIIFEPIFTVASVISLQQLSSVYPMIAKLSQGHVGTNHGGNNAVVPVPILATFFIIVIIIIITIMITLALTHLSLIVAGFVAHLVPLVVAF